MGSLSNNVFSHDSVIHEHQRISNFLNYADAFVKKMQHRSHVLQVKVDWSENGRGVEEGDME